MSRHVDLCSVYVVHFSSRQQSRCGVQGTQTLPTGRLDRYYKEGVVFVTYSTLISKGAREGRGARVPLPDEKEPVGGYAEDSDDEDDNGDGVDEYGLPGALVS